MTYDPRTDSLLIADTDDHRILVHFDPLFRVQGEGRTIANGDAAPSVEDGTDFGAVSPGAAGEQVFAIRNDGRASFQLSGLPLVELGGPHQLDFAIIAQPRASEAIPGASLPFTVRFTPSQLGLHTATITIYHTDGSHGVFPLRPAGGEALAEAWLDTLAPQGGSIASHSFTIQGTGQQLQFQLFLPVGKK